jgi:CRP-like cAMP-binding protein
MIALRPCLADDVKIRKLEDETVLVRLSSGVSFNIEPHEAQIARAMDGSQTIGELIVSQLGSSRSLDFSAVTELVNKCVNFDFLASYPPNFFQQMEGYLAQRSVTLAHDAKLAARDALEDESVVSEPLTMFEQVPWRPRTPLLADRAQFLRTVPLFSDLDSWTIGALAEAVHDETYPSMTNVIREGAEAKYFYVVRSGDLSVQRRDEDGTLHRIAKLGAGDHFGEAGILELATRNASVRVGPTRPAQIMRFERDTFERIISPHISDFRGRQLVSTRRTRLETFEIFKRLSPEDLERLAHAITEHRVPTDTVVVRQGDPGDRFYLVVSGRLGVVRDGVPVASLGEGDFFGETALLFTQDRTATVTCEADSVLWSVDGAAFRELLQKHLLGHRELMPTLMNRVARN